MGETEGTCWQHDGPHDGRVRSDYVFGRMMKLNFTYSKDSITLPDSEPRGDYQSWCHKYKTYADLFAAAEKDLLATMVN